MSRAQTLQFPRPATNNHPRNTNRNGHLIAEDRIIRIDEVCALTGLSRTTIWRRIQDNAFPPSIRLGPEGTRAKGWRLSDIEAWIHNTATAA